MSSLRLVSLSSFVSSMSLASVLRGGAAWALPLLAFGAGCDAEVPTLFAEGGVWEMTEYDIGDGIAPVDPEYRKEAMLLKFRSDLGIVQTAICGNSESDTPANAPCRLQVTATSWFCKCYAYKFENDTMAWKEFPAGEPRPGVDFPADGGGPEEDEEIDPDDPQSGSTLVTVSEKPDVRDTFYFEPLPDGLFGSDGENSRYVFLRKANSLFNQVYDDPEGRDTCEPCTNGF